MVRIFVSALVGIIVFSLCIGLSGEGVSAESSSVSPVAAREFALKDLDNNVRTLKEQRGKIVALNFWATWCGPCRYELPKLHEVYRKLKGDNFEVYAISVDNSQTSGLVKPVASQIGLTFPVLLDTDNRVVMSYNPQGIIPFTVIIDHLGTVRYVHPGYQPGDEVVVEQEIRTLIKQIGEKSTSQKSTSASQ